MFYGVIPAMYSQIRLDADPYNPVLVSFNWTHSTLKLVWIDWHPSFNL